MMSLALLFQAPIAFPGAATIPANVDWLLHRSLQLFH